MGYSIFEETMVEMPWPEVERAGQDGAIVLLPTGVIEEHGPHMDLGVDAYLSYLSCKMTRRELETRGLRTLIAPPFYWGINMATASFPGSFTVRKSTMKALLQDILDSLQRWGFRNVFVLNWQGEHDHNVTLLELMQEARRETGARARYVLPAWQAKRFGVTGAEPHVLVAPNGGSNSGAGGGQVEVHADSLETSVMAAYFPESVNAAMAKTLPGTSLGVPDLMEWRKGWDDGRRVTPQGYFGDPASFDAEAGHRHMEQYAKDLADTIEAALNGSYEPPA